MSTAFSDVLPPPLSIFISKLHEYICDFYLRKLRFLSPNSMCTVEFLGNGPHS
ncbi:hypothetical protein glysoja_032600 [Glycine soja]|uniref:Uncharacterized protein n=1 Tax=Glycine soja TaxID=3848 RepID=A0A0B2RFV5_GLYSO|nr:hypothetical protein glysoja_032600 [Glycine soja]